jgi:N-acetylglucosamine kinase-like BadF-type ATPase
VIAVGVDAGGSGSRAVVVRDGVVVSRRDLGPINVLLHADAVDRLARAVMDAGAAAAGFGLAGLRSDEHARELTAELARRTGARVAVGDDTDAALAGAFAGRPGIVVIAGTGSGAAGRDAAGRTVRVGGHGFLLGDEGGGYWIGREAVRAALRAADGTGPATALTAVVERAFGSLAGAEQEVHRHPAERGLLARLVPEVAAVAEVPAVPEVPAIAPVAGAAGQGDAVAARILAEAAAYLTELAAAVRARLGDLPVAGVGGIFRCAPVRDAFRAATGAADPVEPPELGALRLLDQA